MLCTLIIVTIFVVLTCQVSDAMLMHASFVYPENTPTTKEAYYYRTIFDKFYPKVSDFHFVFKLGNNDKFYWNFSIMFFPQVIYVCFTLVFRWCVYITPKTEVLKKKNYLLLQNYPMLKHCRVMHNLKIFYLFHVWICIFFKENFLDLNKVSNISW